MAGTRDVRLGAGDRHDGRRRDPPHLATVDEVERADDGCIRGMEPYDLMPLEIIRRSRLPKALDIGRAGDGAPVQFGQFAADQWAVRQGACPKNAIEAFSHHVERLMRLADMKPYARISLKKPGEARKQEVPGLRAMHINAYEA